MPPNQYNPQQPIPQQPTLPSDPDQQIPGKKSEGWKSIFSTIAILVAAPLVALFLTTFVFQSYEVDGPSMETTLSNHDRLIVLKAPRTWAGVTGKDYIPARGDIIIFKKSGLNELGGGGEKQLIKRVIGLPGDRVVLSDGKFTIYNTEHPNGYDPDEGKPWQKSIVTTPGNVDVTVGNDEIFASGDNRTNSLDSRFFGPVKAHEIVGKLVIRVFPLGDAQWFN